MDWWVSTLVVFGGLILLILAGVPIAFALSGLAILGFLIVWPDGLGLVGATLREVTTNWVLVAIPLFVLMGEVIVFSGLSEDFFDSAQKWTGALPGSLMVTTTVMAGTFAAMTGSSPANTAAVGSIAVPEMLKRGYDRSLASAVVVAGGALGILIPPSLAFIFYGMLAGVSVSQLFIAGVLPGIMTVTILCIYIIVRCIVNPRLAPRIASVSWRERVRSLWKVWGVVGLIVVVLGSLYTGVATPTEAAGIGAFGAMLLTIIYGKLTWRHFRTAMLATVRTTSMILVIFVGGMLFSRLTVVLGVAPGIAGFVASLDVSRWWIIIAINILLLILGCYIDPGSLLIIFTPLLASIVSHLGYDLLWFGVIFTINMEVANITPPVGYNLFVLKSIAPDVTMVEIVKGVIPFVLLFYLTVAVLMWFPQIALWLPSMMG